MGETSKIEWTDSTFNPWIGCQHASPGCDHCYAESQNAFRKWTAGGAWGPHAERKRTSAANWKKPQLWNGDAKRFELKHGRRRRVFCASLADVFDNKAPKPWRVDLFNLIRETPNLDWQLLTKRPQNVAKMLPPDWCGGYPNVWLGTTTEDEKHYRMRWPVLARIPAAIRFISYEPAIGTLGHLDLGIGAVPDWVISGGESGPKARTMNAHWVRELRDQCVTLGIPLFHKQWGTYASNPVQASEDPYANGKGGGLLDGRLWRQFPGSSGRSKSAAA
jgi:protein gp37